MHRVVSLACGKNKLFNYLFAFSKHNLELKFYGVMELVH